MTVNIHNSKLAFILALSDLNNPLNESEKHILIEMGKQLDLQPSLWSDKMENILIEMIQSNPELNQHYTQYKSQLDNLPDISENLSEIDQELKSLMVMDNTVRTRGFKPTNQPTGYDSQINNLVVLASRSEEPETVVKQVSSLDKLKQMLGHSGQ
ncbi:MAG: hypothetical protein QNJ42_07025 [Crocosphaera sp.]|nr:hypothetical protein [Crocosphaera sp.]